MVDLLSDTRRRLPESWLVTHFLTDSGAFRGEMRRSPWKPSGRPGLWKSPAGISAATPAAIAGAHPFGRAATWSHERRWRWRAVWKAIVASADDMGCFQADIAVLADAASDRLHTDVADQTVAAVLRWSVLSGLTELVHAGRPTRYRLLVDRHKVGRT
ncbi:hypothetical protein ABZ897_38965 [Nonomuraea sp. NPDC046802]|uniref:hypothetical protein n=1 Tax=Nonomuraea sp. NPDC046802 TaxID=3154919 RepID=UPI0033E3DA90